MTRTPSGVGSFLSDRPEFRQDGDVVGGGDQADREDCELNSLSKATRPEDWEVHHSSPHIAGW